MTIENGKSQFGDARPRTVCYSRIRRRGLSRGICRSVGQPRFLSATLMLSGCAVGPNYARPKVNVPADFRGAEGAAQQASYADLPWWEVFKDEQLKALIKTALANNYDLAHRSLAC